MAAPIPMAPRSSPMSLRSHGRRLSTVKAKTSPTSSSDHADLASSISGEEINEDEDDGDDESDQPAVNAPSYGKANQRTRKTGRPKKNLKIQTTFQTDISEMFGTPEHALHNLDKMTDVFDFASSEDDDDQIYQAVDDISDDEDALEFQDEQMLFDEFNQEPLNFLDTLSDIGNDEDFALGAIFDDFSSHSSSESSNGGPTQNGDSTARRVAFEEADNRPASPITALTILKAPASSSSRATNENSPLHPSTFHNDGSDYDSEMTDEDLPSEVNGTPDILHIPPIQRSNSDASPRPAKGRGPRCGWFDIDPKQSWSILHPSGKKMLIMPRTDTGRHDWLDQKLRSTSVLTSASSAPPSTPVTDGSQTNMTPGQNVTDYRIDGEMITGMVNPIMAALTRTEGSNDTYGHATGPPEAFAPLPVFHDAADYQFDFDSVNTGFLNEDDEDPEDQLMMSSFIKYDDEESSDDGEARRRPSTAMPPPKTPIVSRNRSNSAFAHLNNLNSENVMAFRRNTESLRSRPMALADVSPFTPSHGLMRDAFHSPKTALPASTRSHKRKASNEPYSSSHYEGVTPVERKILKASSHAQKKRKLTL